MNIYEKQNASSIAAHLFFLREEKRLPGIRDLKAREKYQDPIARKQAAWLIIDELAAFAKQYNVTYKGTAEELSFRAELAHFRYYPVGDFELLVMRSFDFSNIIQKEQELIGENPRRGFGDREAWKRSDPAWKKGLGTMRSINEYYEYLNKKKKHN